MKPQPTWSIAAGLAAGLIGAAAPASAVVVVSDGFGDANRNNDGVIDRFDWDADANTTLGPWEAPNFPGSSIPEVDTPTDVTDTGIRWHGGAGFTGTINPNTGVGDGKIFPRIIDDTAGVSAEGFSLDSGLALGLNSKGRGSTVMGFFGQNVALGANVGDQVKVSYDARLWTGAPNANTPAVPTAADLRFGLYQDTDNQLGQTSSFAGAGFTPATWGEDDGVFDGQFAGPSAENDRGWAGRIKIGSFYPTDGADATTPSGSSTTGPRIFEETNVDPSGIDPQRKRILQGSDDDFVAAPDDLNPNFTTLLDGKNYNLALTLERTAQSILATFTVENLTDGGTFSFGGEESLNDGASDPGSGGIQSDNWDYFALRVSSANSFGETDFDLVIDNFLVETFDAVTAIDGDYNGDGSVDQGDLDLVLLNWGDDAGQTGVPAGWVNMQPTGLIGQTELDGVLLNWGNTAEASGSAVPEPATAALLALGGVALLRRRHHD